MENNDLYRIALDLSKEINARTSNGKEVREVLIMTRKLLEVNNQESLQAPL
jgi:phage anti-repressor protein